MIIELRGYQRKLVAAASQFYRDAPPDQAALLMQSATGSGKTRTAAYIVDKYASTGRQVLWLVHREELLMQAALTFAEYGIKHRLVCAASSERAIKAQEFREHGRSFVDSFAPVVIASIQTIVRRLEVLPWLQPTQIVADEAHLSLAATWRRVLARWPQARLLGLTATPTRLDGQTFDRQGGGLYDAIITGPRVSDLIGWGNLADFEVYAPPLDFTQAKRTKMKGGDFDPKALESEFAKPVIFGDVVGHYRKYSHGKPAIAFCPTVAVSERFAQAFRDAGYRAVAIDGQTDDTVRRRSLQELARGELDVVTSVSILVEGTDVPLATTALLLRRTQSLSLYLQAVGRVLRPHPQKDRAIILDFVGAVQAHGMPDADREWTLEGKPRSERAGSDQPAVTIRTCPKCFAIHAPAPACPSCSYAYTTRDRAPQEVAGELVRITPEMRAQMAAQAEAERKQAKRQRITEERQCATLAELEQLGRDRGYRFAAAWAAKRWQFIKPREAA